MKWINFPFGYKGWEGLDLQNDSEMAHGAQAATGTRRDNGVLACVQPPVAVATDGTATVRGIAVHRQADSSILRLSASSKLYVDGVAADSVTTGTDFVF